jgi:hypothetical protein
LWLAALGKTKISELQFATLLELSLIVISLPLRRLQSATVVKFQRFLGAFAKLREATVSFFMSVRLSVIMEQIGSQWTDFH